MALYIKEQSIYLKGVKGRKSKDGKVYVTGLGAFLSNYKNDKDERIYEPAFNVVVKCFKEDVFDVLREYKEKAGFLNVSGKVLTNAWQRETGEWVNSCELIVTNASLPDKKEEVDVNSIDDDDIPF